jgi:hypothetical protein
MEQVKHVVIVKVKNGMKILDRPASTTDGALTRRIVPNGTSLDAYSVHYIHGIPYARLVPQFPNKPEYIRIAERDESMPYCDVINLDPDSEQSAALLAVLERIATALERGQ